MTNRLPNAVHPQSTVAVIKRVADGALQLLRRLRRGMRARHMTEAKHCVFCNGTGVHQCPGGYIPVGYWTRRWRLEGTTAHHFLEHGGGTEAIFPGLVNAEDYYALPEFDPLAYAECVLEDATLCPCSDQPEGDV